MDVGSLMDIIEIFQRFSNDISLIMGALANAKRIEIVCALNKGQNTFKELQTVTGLGKTALAHHLALLVETGLIHRTERGQYELSRDAWQLLEVIGTTYADSKRKREAEMAKRANYIQKIHTKEIHTMKDLDVKIVELEPMRVASVQAIGESPEDEAWNKMRTWAEPRGLLEDLEEHPVFGFDNPEPSPGQKEYGYEFWIKVGPEEKGEGDVKIKEFHGGLYAVITCNLKEELESEFFKKNGYLESWKKIVEWVKSSNYTMGSHQCLEKAHYPGGSVDELILDLYCPIVN
ncbi:MAG: GyrI-like domain-containing protein [Theionarchaea archaeon]|nr:GyrI-like domain-containing protein [Theionarchaea archaeon]